MYKPLYIIVLLLFTAVGVKAQAVKVNESTQKNELHLNLLTVLSEGFAEVSYERLLTDNSAVGLAAFVPVIKDDTYAYGFIPYYRLFFGKKKSAGLFLEGSLAALARKDNYKLVYDDYGGYSSLLTTSLNYGYGVAVGTKLMSKNHIVVNLYGGVVRLFNANGDSVFPRVGVTIGKRF